MANMHSAAPNLSLLRKFEAAVVLCAFSIPLIVANTRWCPGSLGLLSSTDLFASFVRNDVASGDQICLYEDLLTIYILCAIPGFWVLRSSLQQRTIDLQISRNKTPDLKKARSLCLSIFVFSTFVIFFAALIPDSGKLGHLDRAFEIKKLYMEMYMICGDVIAFGLVIAFWRERSNASSIQY